MEEELQERISDFYSQGNSIRKISSLINKEYGYESIRKVLKKKEVSLRGRGQKYKQFSELNSGEKLLFAELLGFMYGDGSLHKNKMPGSGIYGASLFCALNESDLVNRLSDITQNLFLFKPRISEQKHIFFLKLRASFAKHLHEMGYPVGKKSLLNPKLPIKLLCTKDLKESFIRGFFNAEASINRSVSVQQSVRLKLTENIVNLLKEAGSIRKLGKNTCYFIRWRVAKVILEDSMIIESNILKDIKLMLLDLGISSKIYPIRVYIGSKGCVGLHYELSIPALDLRKIKDFKLIGCEKKVVKLNKLLQE